MAIDEFNGTNQRFVAPLVMELELFKDRPPLKNNQKIAKLPVQSANMDKVKIFHTFKRPITKVWPLASSMGPTGGF